jgi:hypothetical protein
MVEGAGGGVGDEVQRVLWPELAGAGAAVAGAVAFAGVFDPQQRVRQRLAVRRCLRKLAQATAGYVAPLFVQRPCPLRLVSQT